MRCGWLAPSAWRRFSLAGASRSRVDRDSVLPEIRRAPKRAAGIAPSRRCSKESAARRCICFCACPGRPSAAQPSRAAWTLSGGARRSNGPRSKRTRCPRRNLGAGVLIRRSDALGQFGRASATPARGVASSRSDSRSAETAGGGTVTGREQAFAFLSRLIARPFLGSRRSIPEYRPTPSAAGSASRPIRSWRRSDANGSRTRSRGRAHLTAHARCRRGLCRGIPGRRARSSIGESSRRKHGETATLALASGWKAPRDGVRECVSRRQESCRRGSPLSSPWRCGFEDILAGRDAVLDRARASLTDAARRLALQLRRKNRITALHAPVGHLRFFPRSQESMPDARIHRVWIVLPAVRMAACQHPASQQSMRASFSGTPRGLRADLPYRDHVRSA